MKVNNPLQTPKAKERIADTMKKFREGLLTYKGKTVVSRDEAKKVALLSINKK